jgi:hypothetical protein
MKTLFNHTRPSVIKKLVIPLFCLLATGVKAQVDTLPGDPAVIMAYTIQHLHFGTFSAGNTGGTLILSTTGSRTTTGTVVAINQGASASAAMFDVDAVYGAMVSVLNGPDVTLTGSNGGSMLMHIGASNPASPFITTVRQPLRTHVYIGATLTVGSQAANPPGTYSGNFYVTFALE